MAQYLRRQIILQCINAKKGNNKYYEINVRQVSKDKYGYSVDCRWGRIEHFQEGNPQAQVKGEDFDQEEVDAEVGKILYAKLKKGYTVFKDTNQNSENYSGNGSVSPQKPMVPFERTEHVEIAPLSWWNRAEDNIEERAV